LCAIEILQRAALATTQCRPVASPFVLPVVPVDGAKYTVPARFTASSVSNRIRFELVQLDECQGETNGNQINCVQSIGRPHRLPSLDAHQPVTAGCCGKSAPPRKCGMPAA
jgi:hypothetical protein